MKYLRRVARVADRQQENWHRIRIGRADAGECVLGAGTRLHSEDADPLAVLHAGKSVGDADADTFLAADDRSDARGRRGFDHGVRRIAGEKLDAFALENFSDNIDDSHRTSLCYEYRIGRSNSERKTGLH